MRGTGLDETATDFMYKAMPFTRKLGTVVIRNSAEEVRLRLVWKADLCTSGGALHGGAIMSVADSAAGACAFNNLPAGAAGTATVSSSTHFIRPVADGYVEAVAKPLHVGRSFVVVDVTVLNASGEIVAKAAQCQVVRGPAPAR